MSAVHNSVLVAINGKHAGKVGSIEFGLDGFLCGGLASSASNFFNHIVCINTRLVLQCQLCDTLCSVTSLSCGSAPSVPQRQSKPTVD